MNRTILRVGSSNCTISAPATGCTTFAVTRGFPNTFRSLIVDSITGVLANATTTTYVHFYFNNANNTTGDQAWQTQLACLPTGSSINLDFGPGIRIPVTDGGTPVFAVGHARYEANATTTGNSITFAYHWEP